MGAWEVGTDWFCWDVGRKYLDEQLRQRELMPIVVEAGMQDQSIHKLGFSVSSLQLVDGYLFNIF